MKTSHLYLALCLIGLALPYSRLVPCLAANGLDPALLWGELTPSRLAAFGWLDIIISALALFVFIDTDGRRQQVPWRWLPFLDTLTVGVSLGLPLYLLLRKYALASRRGG